MKEITNPNNQTLILTHPDYFLLVDLSDAGKDGDYCLDMDCKVFKQENHFPVSIGQRKIIGHLPKSNQPPLQGVPLLPDLPKVEEDVEALADKANGYTVFALYTKAPVFKEGFIAGYKAKQSEKGFSEQEMREAILVSWNKSRSEECANYPKQSNNKNWNVFTEIIQSLITPQQPKGFIVEYETCLQALPKDRFTPKIINNTICGKWIF